MLDKVQIGLHYFPYGMLMPNRKNNTGLYRYGFQGQEKDDEVKGEGNHIAYDDRGYDPRIGRWMSTDKLEKKYPMLSSYSFTANNPIMNRELDGRDWTVSTSKDPKSGNTTIKITLDAVVVNTSNNQALDMQGLADAVKSQVQTSYSMTYKNEDGTTTTVEATVNIRTVENISNVKDNEHLVQVVNKGEYKTNGYGRAPFNGNQLYLNEQYVQGIIDGDDNNTVPHEIGHTAGLKHSDLRSHMTFQDMVDGQNFEPCTPCVEDNVDNAMYSGSNPNLGGATYLNDKTSTEINEDQIKVLKKNADNGELNKNTRGT